MSSAYRRLISALIIRMLQDWEQEYYRHEIRAFMSTPYFENMVEALDLDPAFIRNQIESGQFNIENIHSVYR